MKSLGAAVAVHSNLYGIDFKKPVTASLIFPLKFFKMLLSSQTTP